MSKNKPKNGGLIFAAGTLLLFAALFIAGSFCDLYIAERVYTPMEPVAFCVTTFGLYPYFAAYILIFGVLCRQAELSSISGKKKWLVRVICVYLTFSTGSIGAGVMLSRNCLAAIYPGVEKSVPLFIAIDLLLMLPVFIWGRSIKLPYSPRLVKRLIRIIILIFLAFLMVEALKMVLIRPRYRLTASGAEDFVPWFECGFTGFKYYFNGAGEHSSFPSGHSVSAASCILIFYSLPFIFPRLNGKETLLGVIGLLCGLCVMLSRMVLGAHYLSDVSCGAFFAALAFLADRIAAAREESSVRSEELGVRS